MGANQEANSRRIGEFIRERRQANGLTQRELGELAGVGTRFISEVERGKATVRLNVVDQVLSVFGKQLGVIERPIEAAEEPT